MGKLTNFRLGHFQIRKLLVITRGYQAEIFCIFLLSLQGCSNLETSPADPAPQTFGSNTGGVFVVASVVASHAMEEQIKEGSWAVTMKIIYLLRWDQQ